MPSYIAYINNHFPALSHTFIYKEVIGLRERGVPIRTFSIRKPKLDSLSADSIDLYQSTTYLLPVDVVQFVRAHLYFFSRRPLMYFWILLFLMTRKFRRGIKDRVRTFFHFCEGVYFGKLIMDSGNIHHIHAHYANHPATLAMVASILTKIPFSFTAHAVDIWEDHLFVKEKVNASSFVITCSNYGREAILSLPGINNPEKISTIYHGVDIKYFNCDKSAHENSKPIILNIGRLFWHKAQHDLIMACKALKDEGYDFKCHIVGEGPLFDYLDDLIRKNKLEKNVTLDGKVLQENIKDYYQNADVFVLSSVSENLPNVLLECLAMGLPVISTSIAGIPELIKDRFTGLLVKPRDIEGLAAAIKLLIADSSLRETLSRNGRNLIYEDFDDEKCLDKILSLFYSHNVVR